MQYIMHSLLAICVGNYIWILIRNLGFNFLLYIFILEMLGTQFWLLFYLTLFLIYYCILFYPSIIWKILIKLISYYFLQTLWQQFFENVLRASASDPFLHVIALALWTCSKVIVWLFWSFYLLISFPIVSMLIIL